MTHQVVDVDRSGEGVEFTTQGDANDRPDADPVGGEQVVGVVAFTIPLIGWVVNFAGTSVGLLFFVVVPCVLLVANEAYELLYTGSDDTTVLRGPTIDPGVIWNLEKPIEPGRRR